MLLTRRILITACIGLLLQGSLCGAVGRTQAHTASASSGSVPNVTGPIILPFSDTLEPPSASEFQASVSESSTLETQPPVHPCKTYLSLQQALCTTLKWQRAVEIARLSVDQQQGLFWQSEGPFDPVITAGFQHEAREDIQIPGFKTHLWAHDTQAEIGLLKRFRIGTLFSATGVVEQFHNPLNGPPPFDREDLAHLTFRIDQPLLRGFIYNPDAVNEVANCLLLKSTCYSTLQSIAETVVNTVNAYWNAVAAKKLLVIAREAEERLMSLVNSTLRLIAENQLARAEIEQPRAQLEAQKAARIAAEQNYYFSVQALKLAMGYVDCEFTFDDRDLCLEEFPKIQSDRIKDLCCRNDLITLALTTRYDIVALDYQEKSFQALLRGACNNSLPEVNAFTTYELIDSRVGTNASSLTGAAEFRNPEKDWTIGVTISFPLCNIEATGEIRQREAQVRQTRLTKELTQQQAMATVISTWSNQLALAMQIDHADRSVVGFQTLLSNELKKLNAGETTLFQLVDYENFLTNALQTQVSLYLDYALNIAQLRLATGTVFSVDDDLDCIEVDKMVTLPCNTPFLDIYKNL